MPDISAAAQEVRIYCKGTGLLHTDEVQRNYGLGSESALYVYTHRVPTLPSNGAYDLARVSCCLDRPGHRVAMSGQGCAFNDTRRGIITHVHVIEYFTENRSKREHRCVVLQLRGQRRQLASSSNSDVTRQIPKYGALPFTWHQ